jgi:multiple antibiotic resistance protein
MDDFLHAVIGLFAITNPLGAAPVFVGVVAGAPQARQREAARQLSLAVFVILGGSALIGQTVLDLFGITIDAFRAAGGLLLVLIATDMLRGGKPSSVQAEHASDLDDQILVPLAMPLIAGPGAITTSITLALGHSRWGVPWVALTAAAVVAALLFVTLRLFIDHDRLLSPRGQRILTRFMGLILMAIGFQLGLGGIRSFFAVAG